MARGRKPAPGGLSEPAPPAPNPGDPPPLAPPAGLGKAALAKWHQLVPIIARAVALTEADLDALATYVDAWVTRARALRELEDDDLVIVTPNGARQINPLRTIADKCEATVMKLSERFGLDPASRKRLKIAAKKSASPFAQFMADKPARANPES